ncbi:TIGR03960 family B12-binding radical SAM protein [Tepidimicrobium xylanilyticum]|uniref:TIGR03960 family B12-binding radical SAM protein n=1 Tax=Tepidimicrobium xylanilyticum TaxID=1123352 RepID=UPI0026523DC7|nr:TIGR03960 family B12-binding radical SAM protein [Tepidimicrobium xylanilyticum]GMG97250.1 radical SAM domain protein [Tepidimicrobium xylanilyticum]
MIDMKKLDKVLRRVEKPARYIGMEKNAIKKDLNEVKVKFAFAFPDIYEVGMSHLGLHILYNLINEKEDMACERVFAPWVDMEEEMIKEGIPLFTLESKESVRNFDFLGFTLQYEMSYTNVINMLNLGGIPILSKDRKKEDPFIIAGGPCAYNPEPIADIIDFFVIGEGEEIILEILEKYKEYKAPKGNRIGFLKEVSKIEGVYVPQFYHVKYNKDNTIQSMDPIVEGIPKIIKKRIIKDLDRVYFPEKLIVPYIETIHDRIPLEIFRGCTRGCRFCQAGMIYRPVREKSVERLLELAEKLEENTGYEDISLTSLSSCDYSNLEKLISKLMDRYEDEKVGISLPSLRLDSFSIGVLKEIQKVRKTGLTFAPEAGSQRLRDVINKGVTDEDLINAVSYAFEEGWSTIKLYFMIGLPTETEEDLLGIRDLGYKVKDIFFSLPKEKRKGNLKVTLSASCFVPKPFTPFQWVGQDSIEKFYEKIDLIKQNIRDKKITFNYHDPKLSYLEAVIARGDRRLGKALIRAWEKGCKFDGWSEKFDFDKWMEAFKETGIDGDFYALREREIDEILPWDFINPGITKEYLIKEYEKAKGEELTRDCRLGCTNCGINRSFTGGVC